MSARSRAIAMLAAGICLGSNLCLSAEAAAQAAGQNVASSSNSFALGDSEPAGQRDSIGNPAQTVSRSSDATPRVELFLGYTHFRGLPTYATGNRMVGLNGGTASLALNFNRYLGLVADFGGFPDTEINLTGPGANPARVAPSNGKVYTYLFGPRFSYRGNHRITPFAQALFGGVHASQVTLDGCTGASCAPLPAQDAFEFTAGGGLDIKVQRHLALRAVQAEYMMTRFPGVTSNASSSQNDLRLSAGLVLRFGGGGARVSPVAYACAVSPASVYPGDPMAVTGTALNLDPKRTATYSWATDGGKVIGTSATANFDLNDVSPGSYTVRGHVSEGIKPNQSADCSAAYTVMAFQPPTVSCSAVPSTVQPGTPVIITAQGASPQNRPLTYSYAASGGSINGSSPRATLSTNSTSEAITVTCNVVDDKGKAASSTTTVAIQVPEIPAAPAPTVQKLCSIRFDRDTKRPTRVDNEAKACLDDVALNLQRSPNAKIAIEGNNDSNERKLKQELGLLNASQRAMNAKDYLITDKGIDASRVTIYTGSDDSKTVNMILVPSGASLDMTGLSPVADSGRPVNRRLRQ